MDEQELKKEISRVVDQWVSEILAKRFQEKPNDMPKRSLWDKFKQGLANWWWGPNGDRYNPNVWRNRFGDELGVTESFSPSIFSLHEYAEIRGVIDEMDSILSEGVPPPFEKLRLMNIVRSAAERLKVMLYDALSGKRPSSPPPLPTPAQSASPTTPAAPAAASSASSANTGGPASPAASARSTEPMTGSRRPPTRSAVEDEDEEETGVGKTPVSTSAALTSAPAAAATSPVASSRPSRVTNRAKIEKAADEVEGMDKSKLRPEREWLDKDGEIKKERIPHVLAWMAMKPHLDPLDDESIVRELKSALGGEVSLGLPRSRGGSLRRYLNQTLAGNYAKVMSKLGIDAEDKPKETEKKKEETGAERDVEEKRSAPEREKKDEKTPDHQDDNELKVYFYKGREKRTLRESLSLIFGFVGHLRRELGGQAAAKVAEWWNEKRRQMKEDMHNDEDRMDSMESGVLGSGVYLDQLSDAAGLDKSSLKEKMANYIRSQTDA